MDELEFYNGALSGEAIDNLPKGIAGIYTGGTQNNTGSTFAAGRYLYLGGDLIRIISDIPNGAYFTLGTNYELVSADALGALNTLITSGTSGGIAYIKFPDGTLICRGGDSAYINANSDLDREYNFPIAFFSAPSVVTNVGINPNDASQTRNAYIFANSTTTKCILKIRSAYGYQAPFWWGWVAIGRWKA